MKQNWSVTQFNFNLHCMSHYCWQTTVCGRRRAKPWKKRLSHNWRINSNLINELMHARRLMSVSARLFIYGNVFFFKNIFWIVLCTYLVGRRSRGDDACLGNVESLPKKLKCDTNLSAAFLATQGRSALSGVRSARLFEGQILGEFAIGRF